VKADTDSDPDVTNFTESSRQVASKSRQAVGVATGGAFPASIATSEGEETESPLLRCRPNTAGEVTILRPRMAL